MKCRIGIIFDCCHIFPAPDPHPKKTSVVSAYSHREALYAIYNSPTMIFSLPAVTVELTVLKYTFNFREVRDMSTVIGAYLQNLRAEPQVRATLSPS